MDTVGYVRLAKHANINSKAPETFKDVPCRVFEFASDGGALIINPLATQMCMVEKEDIQSKFECAVEGNFICPPGLDRNERLIYIARCITRKGGYNDLLKRMIIEASLFKGKFNDTFLWQLQ